MSCPRRCFIYRKITVIQRERKENFSQNHQHFHLGWVMFIVVPFQVQLRFESLLTVSAAHRGPKRRSEGLEVFFLMSAVGLVGGEGTRTNGALERLIQVDGEVDRGQMMRRTERRGDVCRRQIQVINFKLVGPEDVRLAFGF